MKWMFKFDCVHVGMNIVLLGKPLWNGNISVCFHRSTPHSLERPGSTSIIIRTFNQLFNSRPFGRHLNFKVCEKNRNRELKFHATNVFKIQISNKADIWIYWSVVKKLKRNINSHSIVFKQCWVKSFKT